MKRKNSCSAAILLLSSIPKTKCGAIKNWFKKSRFVTLEAADIFQALEIITDFTIRQRPEVILLNTSSFTRDFPLINRMVSSASAANGEISILALSGSGKKAVHEGCFEGNFAQVKTELDKIIPKHKRATVAAA